MNKKSQQRVQQHNFNRPRGAEVDPMTVDQLSVCSEEELHQRVQFLHGELYAHHVAPGSSDAAPWEVELAYVHREFDIRRTRKVRHRQYMDSLRGEEVDENSLPDYQGNPPPTWS